MSKTCCSVLLLQNVTPTRIRTEFAHKTFRNFVCLAPHNVVLYVEKCEKGFVQVIGEKN